MPHGTYGSLRSSRRPSPESYEALITTHREQNEVKQRAEANMLQSEWRALRTMSPRSSSAPCHDDHTPPHEKEAVASSLDEATKLAVAKAQEKLEKLEAERQAKEAWHDEQRRLMERQEKLTECLTARYSTSSSASSSERTVQAADDDEEEEEEEDDDEEDVLAYCPDPRFHSEPECQPDPEPEAPNPQPESAVQLEPEQRAMATPTPVLMPEPTPTLDLEPPDVTPQLGLEPPPKPQQSEPPKPQTEPRPPAPRTPRTPRAGFGQSSRRRRESAGA
jgi:hypothetical protein